MKQKDNNTNLPVQQKDKEDNKNLKGYPLYPASEDIFNKYQEEKDINPEDISKTEESIENEEISTADVMDANNDVSIGNLDIPGSELDDQPENDGNEDEENNYYSLGGDDHEDLEENQGE